jgi:hypothetical protein
MSIHELRGVILGDSEVGKKALLNSIKNEEPNTLMINDSQSNQ